MRNDTEAIKDGHGGVGGFGAQVEQCIVGTVVTCVFDTVGWIAMVLVNESDRGQGIATKLIQHALDFLDGRRIKTVRLDATPLDQPVYEKLGFVAEYGITRFEGMVADTKTKETVSTIRPIAQWMAAAVQMDRYVTGTNRQHVIELLVDECPDAVCLLSDENPQKHIRGFAVYRAGARAWQLGPAAAIDDDAGRMLCDHVLGRLSGQLVLIDIPDANASAVDWAQSRRFTAQRHLMRMRRGNVLSDDPQMIWAGSGPEKG